MRNIKIVADSSSDVFKREAIAFSAAPLKIITTERQFVDDESLDVREMVDFLGKYKGKSTTSCPNPEEWLSAFGDADEVFCITITSSLSGSYNAAMIAKNQYEERAPEKRVCVIDSLSTGPEMLLLIRKIEELAAEGKSFDEISEEVREYQKRTGLLFVLESMKNLANNGRVSKISAKLAGVMNIRVIGKASDKGELEPLDKPRGAKMTQLKILERLDRLGYSGGRLHITHCLNAEAAETLREGVLSKFPTAEVSIDKCGGLCSFYAEKGGMLIGFEKG